MAEKDWNTSVAPYSMSYKPLRLIVSQIPEKIKGEQDGLKKKLYTCVFFSA